MSCAESTGQFKLMSSVAARLLAAWTARATSSLPVPLSPVISTVSGVGATCAIRSRSVRMAALEPIISGGTAPLPCPCGRRVLPHHAAVPQGLAHEPFELIDVERFFDVIEGPVPHGLDGRRHRGVGGDHHHLRVEPALFDLDDEFHAVHAGHFQIGHDAIELFALQQLQRLERAGRAVHLVAGGAKHLGHRFAGLAVVIDDQHAAGRMRGTVNGLTGVFHAAASWEVARGK